MTSFYGDLKLGDTTFGRAIFILAAVGARLLVEGTL